MSGPSASQLSHSLSGLGATTNQQAPNFNKEGVCGDYSLMIAGIETYNCVPQNYLKTFRLAAFRQQYYTLFFMRHYFPTLSNAKF